MSNFRIFIHLDVFCAKYAYHSHSANGEIAASCRARRSLAKSVRFHGHYHPTTIQASILFGMC